MKFEQFFTEEPRPARNLEAQQRNKGRWHSRVQPPCPFSRQLLTMNSSSCLKAGGRAEDAAATAAEACPGSPTADLADVAARPLFAPALTVNEGDHVGLTAPLPQLIDPMLLPPRAPIPLLWIPLPSGTPPPAAVPTPPLAEWPRTTGTTRALVGECSGRPPAPPPMPPPPPNVVSALLLPPNSLADKL